MSEDGWEEKRINVRVLNDRRGKIVAGNYTGNELNNKTVRSHHYDVS